MRATTGALILTIALWGDAMMSKAYSNVSCQIRANRTDAGTRLEAVINASGPVSGTYVFTVKSGSSVPKSQRGDFEITSTGPSEVRKEWLDLAPGEPYAASLDVKWPGGASSCSASGS
jgi:hypothetical protein